MTRPMDIQFLKYSRDLDTTVIEAIENDLKASVISSEKLTRGEFNHTYKVKTPKGYWVARIFRQRNTPVDGKLEWIEKQLSEHNIPHATTIFYTRDTKYFPYGYMVQEFIEGKNGFDAIMDGDLSFEEFFEKEAILLQKIHNIPTRKFGEIHQGGIAEFDTYYEYRLSKYEETVEKLKQLEDIDNSIHEAVFLRIQQLEKYNKDLKPCLLHGDPPPGNAIIQDGGEIVLIDWDNAVSSSWVDEYAGLVTRGAFMWQHKLPEEERNKIIKRAFKRNYDGPDFDGPYLSAIVDILGISQAYQGLVVSYFQHQDLELYNAAKKKLNALLGS